MRIAVVHDYFTQMGGAEQVAAEIVRMFPNSDLFSTVAFPDSMPRSLVNKPVHTCWMQHLPFIKRRYRYYFMLYPLGVKALDLSGYDLVISSSSGYAKGVRTVGDTVHVCYCHTPMRWAWNFDDYLAHSKKGILESLVLPRTVKLLRRWDLAASRRPDYFVANSAAVAERIMRVYGRTAKVIHPPINTNRFQPSIEQGDFYLVLSRLVSYKRIDLAVDACTRLGRRLIVIGTGPDRPRLEARAGPTVSFLGRLSDTQVDHYASRCRALLFPGEEDFGMAPLEIAAAGRPTIAYRGGGTLETVIEGRTGEFFDRQDSNELIEAIKQFERKHWNQEVLRNHALRFGTDAFQGNFHRFLISIGCPTSDEAFDAPSGLPVRLVDQSSAAT